MQGNFISFDLFSDGGFDCGEVSHIKILVQILLHTSPPIDSNRSGRKKNCFSSRRFIDNSSDLLYVQHVKSMGNRQTFHPNKLDYDLFNIEIDIGLVNLFLHGLFLKKLWWVKVSSKIFFLSRYFIHILIGRSFRLGSSFSRYSRAGINS